VAVVLSHEAGKPAFYDTFNEALSAAVAIEAPLYGWASKLEPANEEAAHEAGIELIHIEDGFVRSVGLGAGLSSGNAYAMDRQGIYYDGTRPSDIEAVLESTTLSAEQAERGADLRALILEHRLSKYNVGVDAPTFARPENRERVLVPGQVAQDAAIRLTRSATIDCAGSENVNLDLLKAARARRPDAYIIYKPHPDVSSDLRPGYVAEKTARAFADAFVRDADIVDLIEWCDRVETISSLTGFEALLREKAVTCHGLPFYAGWGLTEDLTPCQRRGRKRSIDELVYVALVAYCRYVDPLTMKTCEIEELIDSLATLKASRVHKIKALVMEKASWLGRKLGI